jgi:hypothetical protein
MMVVQPIEEEKEDVEPKYTLNLNTTQQIIEDQFDFNKTPNYLSFFEQQPATVNLDFNDEDDITKPSLPASIREPTLDKDAFNKKPKNPRSLSPLDMSIHRD